ncbi:unnamed protein product [Ostreobium quekettii]|uniref:Major facilitator superfamily (MFS) profile domain-containing protein n=1 Tax=Ostreobium quekettii TaxID=121088 RepID=A0A8S1J8E5_9CHLO|nr:unnamed protein product [Ostreobium quekettii]
MPGLDRGPRTGMGLPAILWVAVVASLLGAFEYGYAMGVLNEVLDTMATELNFNKEVGGAVVVSIMLLGAAAGALNAGVFADHVGPKRAQVVNVLFFVIGGALSAVSTKRQFCWTGMGRLNGCVPKLLLVGRIITGFGAGCASLYTPRYLAEIAPVNLRGSMGGWYQVLVNVGILGGYLVALPYGFNFEDFTINGVTIAWWRVMLALSIVPAIVQLGMLTFCPESPVWLEWKGKEAQASAVKVALWGELGNQIVNPMSEPLLGPSTSTPRRLSRHHGHHGHHGHHRTRSSLSPHTHHSRRHSFGHPPAMVRSPSMSRSGSYGSLVDSYSNLLGSFGSYGNLNCSSSHGSLAGYPAGPSQGIVSGNPVNNALTLDMTSFHLNTDYHSDPVLESMYIKEREAGKEGAAEGWSALVMRKYRWMVILAIGIPVLQQLSGINTVVMYSKTMFMQAGVSNPLAGTIYTGIVNLVVTVLSTPFVDHLGRRPLLLMSHAGMGLCLVGLATSTLGTEAWLGTVSLFCILAYMMFFAGGAGPVPWIYLSEILPESIKGRLAALATALTWVVNLFVVFTFPLMLNTIGVAASYMVYAALNVGGVAFIYFLLIETKCQTMDEIVRKLVLPD